MKWVTAIIALSLLSLFSNATNSANLDGKVFSPFDKIFFSILKALQVMTLDLVMGKRLDLLLFMSTGLQCFEGIRLVFVAV